MGWERSIGMGNIYLDEKHLFFLVLNLRGRSEI